MYLSGERIKRVMTPWRIVIVVTLLFALAQDAWTILDEPPSIKPQNWVIEAVGLFLFALMAHYPRVCGSLVVIMWAVCAYFPEYIVFFGTAVCGLVTMAYFSSRRLYQFLIPSIILMAISDFTAGSFDALTALFVVLGYLIVSAVGWSFGHYQRLAEKAGRETEKIRLQAGVDQVQLRNALAQDLHDSLAADLTRLTLITENLAKNPQLEDSVRESLDLVSGQSREALVDLRTTIRQLKTPVDEQSSGRTLCEILQDSVNVAKTANITLELEIPDDLENQLNRYEETTLQMLVTESTTNLVKYGKSGTTAEISVEIAGDDIEFMATNEIGGNRVDYAMTSGLGLKQMTAYLERRGGSLEYVASQGKWLVHAEIPRDMHNKMLNTPLNHRGQRAKGQDEIKGEING